MILNAMAIKIGLLVLCVTLTMGQEPAKTPAAEGETSETQEAVADGEAAPAGAAAVAPDDVEPDAPADPDVTADATKVETAAEDIAQTDAVVPDPAIAPEAADTGIAAPVVPDSGSVPCGAGDFVPPVLTPVEDAACFFAKNGWFPPGASTLNPAELLAELTTLLAPDAASLTPELGLAQLKKCYASFKPLPLDVLQKNRGGLSGDLFGGKQGFDVDLFDVTKSCPAVIGSLTSVRTGGVTAPVEVVKLCIAYFGNVVIGNVLASVAGQGK